MFQGKQKSDVVGESTTGGVTTIMFGASSGGQTVFVQNIETLQFQNGDQLHPPFPNVPPPLA